MSQKGKKSLSLVCASYEIQRDPPERGLNLNLIFGNTTFD